jgi:hypothetical protein
VKHKNSFFLLIERGRWQNESVSSGVEHLNLIILKQGINTLFLLLKEEYNPLIERKFDHSIKLYKLM